MMKPCNHREEFKVCVGSDLEVVRCIECELVEARKEIERLKKVGAGDSPCDGKAPAPATATF